MNLSGQIDKLRKLKNKNVADLARSAGVSSAAMSRFLNGETDLGYRKFTSVLNDLEVSVPEIIKRKLGEETGLIDKSEVEDEADLLLLFTNLSDLDKKIVLDTIVKALPKSKSRNFVETLKRVKSRIGKL